MNVVMVKHTPKGKVFWFEVPENLASRIEPGVRVACDTYRGVRSGTAVSTALNANDVKDVMAATGAVEPLRKIVNVARSISLGCIKIPSYMAQSRPSDEKIAKRFLELYHTGDFQTNITVNKDGTLVDGYTAYLVAKKVGREILAAIVKDEEA